MNPFDPDSTAAFRRWRDEKLRDYPEDVSELIVPTYDPRALTADEHLAMTRLIGKTGMVIYAAGGAIASDKTVVNTLGSQFGLARLDNNLCADEDAISSLETAQETSRAGYIPYTNRPLAWHTDGYYNESGRRIRAFILHCVRPAAAGGTNTLLDPEIVFLQLRERDPAYVRALMHPAAMSIPANRVEGQEIRPETVGPVFSIMADGNLHMRYTHRKRNIRWRDEPVTREALACLREILETPGRYHFTATLQAGQGLVCNNVLHTRSGFEANSRRLLYRARYLDRIRG